MKKIFIAILLFLIGYCVYAFDTSDKNLGYPYYPNPKYLQKILRPQDGRFSFYYIIYRDGRRGVSCGIHIRRSWPCPCPEELCNDAYGSKL